MQLKTFLSLTPGYVFTFFNTYFVENFKTIIELLLICPDKVVRSVVSSIMAYCINILVSFYNLPLDVDPEEKLDEQRTRVNQLVLDFLKNYLSLLPTEVAKNWNKFQQYFDVFFNHFSINKLFFLK